MVVDLHKTKSLKVQSVLTNSKRFTELVDQFQIESKNRNSLAAKIGAEAYIELHADLESGQLPWPSECQAALERAQAKK